MTDFAELNKLLDDAAQGMVPADLKAKGWRYVDPPGRLSPEAWNYLLDWMGDGEYQCIAMSAGRDKHGEAFKRGQFFVSPQGMRNMADKERGQRLKPTATPAQPSAEG
ncbi:hypothetical protein [Tardiphaga sp.]|uniref:hypothetical protein n=1 Tax=Tardiphaga sp. TaxID=1926292 RepID=UPI002610A8BE|nr:hypothetical protein [Tardiphaga sp.]MDB5616047.1 hypothetical protein [Tardiphaga sp.]